MISSITSTIKSSTNEVSPQVKKAVDSAVVCAKSIRDEFSAIPAKIREERAKDRDCREQRNAEDVN